jgi:hypothetical protein
MDAAEELALVRAALADTVSNSVQWRGGVLERMSRDVELNGLLPKAVRDALRTHARNNCMIVQRTEKLEQFKDKYKFCYDIVLNFDYITKPVYVEICYSGIEPDFPRVLLVSVHPSIKSRS